MYATQWLTFEYEIEGKTICTIFLKLSSIERDVEFIRVFW